MFTLSFKNVELETENKNAELLIIFLKYVRNRGGFSEEVLFP